MAGEDDDSRDSANPNQSNVSQGATTQVYALSSSVPTIEKLQGNENYSTWRFAMRMSLLLEGLFSLVNGNEAVTVANRARDQRALAKICLSIKPVCYVHVTITPPLLVKLGKILKKLFKVQALRQSLV